MFNPPYCPYDKNITCGSYYIQNERKCQENDMFSMLYSSIVRITLKYVFPDSFLQSMFSRLLNSKVCISGYLTPKYVFPATLLHSMYSRLLYSKVCISGYFTPKYVFPATLLQGMHSRLLFSKICISSFFSPKYVFPAT